jgi:homoserine kinase
MIIKAHAPASLSNLGPGFDILGLALTEPEEYVSIELRDDEEIRVSCTGPFGERLPKDKEQNIAFKAALAVRDTLGSNQGFNLEVYKEIPPGSGLGSSGASAAAGVAAANHAFGANLDLETMLSIAADAERLSSGSKHLDNVSPSLLGGFVAVVDQELPRIEQLPFPEHWHLAVVLPHVTVKTSEARAVLPEAVPMADALANLRDLAGLLIATREGDLKAFGRHLDDHLALPYRRALTPYLSDVQAVTMDVTGMRLQISGSGPAVFAACPDKATAEAVCEAVREKLVDWHIEATQYVSKMKNVGAIDRIEETAG